MTVRACNPSKLQQLRQKCFLHISRDGTVCARNTPDNCRRTTSMPWKEKSEQGDVSQFDRCQVYHVACLGKLEARERRSRERTVSTPNALPSSPPPHFFISTFTFAYCRNIYTHTLTLSLRDLLSSRCVHFRLS